MSSYSNSSTSINSINADELSEVTSLSRVSTTQNLSDISDLSLSDLFYRGLVSLSTSESEIDIPEKSFGTNTSFVQFTKFK